MSNRAPSLPPGTAMGRVRLRVHDINAALDFYVDTLGLREVSRANGTVALSPTGSPPHLVVLEEDPAVAPRPERIPGL